MAREINAELLDTKIEKAQKDLVKAKHRYDAAAATLKDLLDKKDKSNTDLSFIFYFVTNANFPISKNATTMCRIAVTVKVRMKSICLFLWRLKTIAIRPPIPPPRTARRKRH